MFLCTQGHGLCGQKLFISASGLVSLFHICLKAELGKILAVKEQPEPNFTRNK